MFKTIKRLLTRDPGGMSQQQLSRLIGMSAATSSGMPVTPDSALRTSAVFGAVRVLSEDVAKLPLHLKRRRAGGGADIVTDHPVARLLSRPNGWQTGFEFRQMTQAHLALRGNAYAVELRDGRGAIRDLIPVHPDTVTIFVAPGGDVFYQIARRNAHDTAALSTAPLMVPSEDVLHLRWMPLDGLRGVSPIEYARESVGLSLAAERHGSASFGNGARPAGVIKHPGKLNDEIAARLREQWQATYGNPNNAGKTAILEEGMTFEALRVSNEDAQFLETRRFQIEEVARIFRVPLHMLQDLQRATHSNIEQQSIDYVTNTLMAWLELWEAALDRDLLLESERAAGLFLEFDVNRLLRGDIKSRFEAYNIGRNMGVFSANEIRVREGLNPVEGGDTYLQPMNMEPLGTPSGADEPTTEGTTDA